MKIKLEVDIDNIIGFWVRMVHNKRKELW